jgi:hypothetical protein
MHEGWAAPFVAMSAALGEPLDVALASIGDDARAEAEGLAASLRGAKGARARAAAIAAVLAGVAREIEEAVLA